MKNISEMTLEELQDYAVTLRDENQQLKDKSTEDASKYEELLDLNKSLQKRNNELFKKVAQEVDLDDDKNVEPPTVESIEAVAKTKYKEIIRL